MLKIGKIITFNENEFERIERVLDDIDIKLFFMNELYSKESYVNNLPCIYIGFNDLKVISSNLDITDNKINENTYWVFSYEEDKSYYRSNLTKFINILFHNHINKYSYEILDYFFLDFNEIKGFIDFDFLKDIDKVYIINHSIYFTKTGLDKIFNISLKMVKFYNGNDGVNYIIKFLKSNSKEFFIDSNSLKFHLYKTILEEYIDETLLERNIVILF